MQYVGEDTGSTVRLLRVPSPDVPGVLCRPCTLAQQFLSKDEDEEEEEGKFISKHKYESQYGRTLSFMAGEVSRAKGLEGIKKLLRLLGESDQELVGFSIYAPTATSTP